ncbi:MAG: serine/threonine-protein kinase, partial [Myxococcota bacterium]
MREGDSATDDVTRVLDPGAAAYPRVFADPDPAGSLGRYAIIEELGRGGMGVVLRAYDPNLQREVALKIVRTSALSADAEGRLVREARAMARLSHPNVVAIFDVVVEEMTDGAAQSRVVLAMEYVAGSTLRRWLLAEDRTADEVLDRFVRAGRGLAAAHREGLLHRDFKPDNVLVGDDGRVRVTDFGLARFEVGSESGGAASGPQRVADPAADPEHAVEADRSGPLSDASNLLSSSGTPLTRAGTVMGTPRYMAPEQHRDESLTAAIDQYAFCIALWEALLVESPFSGEGKALARAKAQGPPPWPDKGVVSAGIAAAIRRGLSPDPARRFDDMEALLAELSTPKSQTVRRWAPLLLTGAVTGALSWAAFARDPDAPQCTGAGPAMAEVWNADRRASVRSAILATEVAFAPGVHERIGRQLDAWATRWRAAHTETCEATRVRGEQSEAVMDRRMACLQRARSELDAAVRVLTEATSSTVGRAHRVVDGLPRLSRCADVERLLADVAPPSPGQAAAVAVIRADLARSAAQERAGAYAQAQESALRAEAKTASLDYPPIRTEVWLQLANVHDAMGRFADAERALREAQRLGARWQQWELVGDATRQLMWILGYQQARYSEALALREVAEGLSSTPRAEAAFRNNLATILNAQGKYVEAEAELRAALALKVQVVGAAHVGTASTR